METRKDRALTSEGPALTRGETEENVMRIEWNDIEQAMRDNGVAVENMEAAARILDAVADLMGKEAEAAHNDYDVNKYEIRDLENMAWKLYAMAEEIENAG